MIFIALSKTNNRGNSLKVSLYQQNQWNEINTFSTEVRYSNSYSDNKSWYSEWENAETIIFENNQFNTSKTQNAEGYLNFEHKLKKITIEEGTRFSWKKYDFTNHSHAGLNKVQYNELRNNIYVNATGRINKQFFYQAGVYADLLRMTMINNYNKFYMNLNPSARLTYNMNNKNNIKLSYLLRRQIPSFTALNPTPISLDSTRIYKGNISLKPSYTNYVQLEHHLSANGIYLFSIIGWNLIKKAISAYGYLSDNKIYISTFENSASCNKFFFKTNISIQLFTWWQIGGSAGINYSMYKNKDNMQLNKNLWQQANLDCYNNFYFGKFQANVYMSVPFKSFNLTGYSLNSPKADLLLQYKINNNWNTNLGIRYLFPSTSENFREINGYKETNNGGGKCDRFMRIIIGADFKFSRGLSKKNKQKIIRGFEE